MSDSRFPYYRSKANENVRRLIGQQLRAMYELPRETPPRWLTLLLQLNRDNDEGSPDDVPGRDE